MKLKGQQLRHINTITHEGKVVVIGIHSDGTLYYTVRQSGFEDTALNGETQNRFFEDWKKLPLDASLFDASVREQEAKELLDKNDTILMRSRFGKKGLGDENGQEETIKSAQAQVQLVSATGHLYVFRLSTDANCSSIVLSSMALKMSLCQN